MKLYQKARTGKVKWIELYTEGKFLCSKWGLLDSDKIQDTKKECEPKNTGKANATTAAEQAIVEMEAKIVKKKEHGYIEDINATEEILTEEINLDNIPKSFCPCKPKKDPSSKLLNNPNTFGQIKRNGHCIILVKTKKEYIYSRGMESLTEYLIDIPILKETFSKMKEGSMLLTEFCYVRTETGKDSPRKAGEVARQKDPIKALARYKLLSTRGRFEVAPFDIMFDNYEFIGKTDYRTVRYKKLLAHNLPNVPEIIDNWQEFFEEHRGEKESDIEGLILRGAGEVSFIHFTLNGKADKSGSFKYKYVYEDDFVVVRAEKGKAGKQTGLYAQYFLAQYTSEGKLVEYGKCGPGKLKHDRLAELTKEIDSGKLNFPFVIEVEYQSRQEDSGCCEFPQFVRVRYDKKPKECVFDLEDV